MGTRDLLKSPVTFASSPLAKHGILEFLMSERPSSPAVILPENWQELAVDNLYLYAVFAIGLDGTILNWNPGVKSVLGFDEADFVGQPAHMIFTVEDRQAGIPEQELRIAKEKGNAHDVRQHLKQDGSRFWATGAMTALRDETGELTGFAKVVRDSSKSKAMEASLEQLNAYLEDEVLARTADLRELAAQLTLTEQRERERLAQTLHDSVQQELYAIRFALTGLKKELTGHKASETLEGADTLLKKTMQLTRDVTTDLAPPVLESPDLCAPLQWLAESMQQKHGLQVKVVASEVCEVVHDASRILLFNLAQEFLFNVVKHADTPEATLILSEEEEGIELVVEDEGRGFTLDSEAEQLATGLGLSGARKRLQVFGGGLEVDAEPGRGTRITVRLPLSLSG